MKRNETQTTFRTRYMMHQNVAERWALISCAVHSSFPSQSRVYLCSSSPSSSLPPHLPLSSSHSTPLLLSTCSLYRSQCFLVVLIIFYLYHFSTSHSFPISGTFQDQLAIVFPSIFHPSFSPLHTVSFAHLSFSLLYISTVPLFSVCSTRAVVKSALNA